MNKKHQNITKLVESYANWLNDKGYDLNDVMPVGHAFDDQKVIDHVLDVVKNNSSTSFDFGDPSVRNIVVEVLTAYNFMGDGLYEEVYGAQKLHESKLPSSVGMLLESLGEDPYDGPYPETAAEFAKQLNARRTPGDLFRLVDEQEYWDSMGVFSGEDLVRYLIQEDYNDSYKELYGFKPRFNWEGLTIDQMRQKLDDLMADYNADMTDKAEYDSDDLPYEDDLERRPPPTDDDDTWESEVDYDNWEPVGKRYNESKLRKMIREELLRELAYKMDV
jgi:hypothetical protein